jgi:hypothetical protein
MEKGESRQHGGSEAGGGVAQGGQIRLCAPMEASTEGVRGGGDSGERTGRGDGMRGEGGGGEEERGTGQATGEGAS